MFCAPGLVFGGAEYVGSCFHILPARTRFRRCRGRRVLYSCFARPDSFSAIPRTSGPVLMFCTPRIIFDGTEGFGSRIHVLHSQTCFRRYQGRRVPFSCFALPDSFSTVPSASGPVFISCPPRLIFGDTEDVGSYFHVLRSENHFRRCRGRRVPFSCFVLPDSLSTVPIASGPVFISCPP
jgi:hypothetical protein